MLRYFGYSLSFVQGQVANSHVARADLDAQVIFFLWAILDSKGQVNLMSCNPLRKPCCDSASHGL